MTRITATSGSVTTHFDTVFATMIASCAEFCAGARQGRDIEQRYHDFSDLDSRFHHLVNSAAPNRFIESFYDIITLIFHYHYQWNKRDELFGEAETFMWRTDKPHAKSPVVVRLAPSCICERGKIDSHITILRIGRVVRLVAISFLVIRTGDNEFLRLRCIRARGQSRNRQCGIEKLCRQ